MFVILLGPSEWPSSPVWRSFEAKGKWVMSEYGSLNYSICSKLQVVMADKSQTSYSGCEEPGGLVEQLV